MNWPWTFFGPVQPCHFVNASHSFRDPSRRTKGYAHLWRSHNQHWPPRLGDWIAFPGSLLDLLDLRNSPDHRTMQIRINIVEVFYEARLVSIPGKQCSQLSVIHAAKDGPLADLEPIQMQDGEHGPGLFGIDIFVPVPGSGINTSSALNPAVGLQKENSAYVAVGPVSASPSPTTQATIRSGLSITAPKDTPSA